MRDGRRMRWAALAMALPLLLLPAACDGEMGAEDVGGAIETAAQDVQDAGSDLGAALEQSDAVGNAVSEMESLRDELQSGADVDTEAAADRVGQVGDDLDAAFQDAEGEAAERWQAMQPELDALEEDLRTGGADALGDLEAMIERLRADLLTPNE